jgi:phosphate-selective porin OprO/OprP
MGLENLESSRTMAFMEMGSPGLALAPGYRTGLLLNGAHAPWRLAWAAGLFTLGQRQATGDASKALAQLISRFAWHAGHPAGADLLHLGLSMSALFSGQSDIEYQSRPESFKAPIVVDTDSIASRAAAQYGLEAAWTHGPRLVQAELLQSFVTESERSDGNFWGTYLFGSWFLTGEHRPYDAGTGIFQRATPHTDFHFREPGWGAFEAAARISYLDLTSGQVRGGRMLNGTAGLNWYLNPELRLMFNYIATHVTDGSQHGTGYIFQARVELGL